MLPRLESKYIGSKQFGSNHPLLDTSSGPAVLSGAGMCFLVTALGMQMGAADEGTGFGVVGTVSLVGWKDVNRCLLC